MLDINWLGRKPSLLAASVLYLARKTLKRIDDPAPVWVRDKQHVNHSHMYFFKYVAVSAWPLCGTGRYFGALYTLQHRAAQGWGHGRAQAAPRNAYQ